MFKKFRDKIVVSGIAVLIIGVALLVFTFISAYGFLTQSLSIIASEDLVRTFGEVLAPLIATCIRVMYLGVMGWVSSLLTVRGVTIIANVQRVQKAVVEKPVVAKQKEKPREEAKHLEPEFVVIPPEQAEQAQPQAQKEKVEKPEEEAMQPEPEFVVILPEQQKLTRPQKKHMGKSDSASESPGS